MNQLQWPARDFFVQVARFDPSKGLPSVVDSYAKFRVLLEESGQTCDETDIPQLLITGHSSVDDPDGSSLYDEIMQLIEQKYTEYAKDIIVIRLPPNDQRTSPVHESLDMS